MKRNQTIRVANFSVQFRPRTLMVVLIAVALVVILIHLSLTAGSITASQAWSAVAGVGDASDIRSVQSRRLPRVLTAVGVGAALGLSGAVFQSVSRNVLGSPDIIGFTTGAATAAAIIIIFFDAGVVLTGLAAILGGLATTVFVYLMARQNSSTGGLRLVLVGIGTGAFLGAARDFLMVRADITDASTVQLWSAGSLSGHGWNHALLVLISCAVIVPALCIIARRLRLMEMGDDAAGALGISVESTRLLAILLAVLLVGIATAAAGPIAFIALAAPQIARALAREDGVLVAASISIGSGLLVAADYLAQHVDIGLRTPVGLVTSLLGGVYLMWLLSRKEA
ncbi:IRON-siderophore uptake system transmembr [Corynebacterium glutamicum ZL-6]|nr:IRON-siderophore uptake system transmembr [[Brevibacterium] flavum ZL-1]ANR64057.1 IRON-siderophore uptake system transmembr [Corynebacterium glutamicum ZL-6]PST77242.1 IRON-siderophore uptake system transmembr [Corynebacterium glutamicum ZL-2]